VIEKQEAVLRSFTLLGYIAFSDMARVPASIEP
jgi:hypothetical protein